MQDCKIGNNCIIRSGAVVGSDGFAFERLESGELIRFQHGRGVILGNKVEICANTSVCRGSLSDTVIADGTKIDALVHVGVTTDLVYMMAGQRRNVTVSSLSITRISAGLKATSHGMQTAAFLRNLYSAAI